MNESDRLYNTAIADLNAIIQFSLRDPEPDRDEVMFLKTVIKMLQQEKLEQHDKFQRSVINSNFADATPFPDDLNQGGTY